MFEKIKHYYAIGLYKISHLEKLLCSGAITEAEYNKITGDVENHETIDNSGS